MNGLPFEKALGCMLAALGKPPALPNEDPEADVDAILNDVLDQAGLSVSRMMLGQGALPRVVGLGMLAEAASGEWLALLPRPGSDRPELADDEGNLEALPADYVFPGGRAFMLEARPEPDLNVEVKTFLQRHRKHMFPIMLGGLITNLLLLTTPLFGSFVYDKVLGNGVSDTLWAMTLGVVLAIGLDFAARALRIQLVERMAVGTEGDIDRALLTGLLRRTGTMPPVGLVLDKYKQMQASRDFVTSSYLTSAADLPFLLLFLAAIAIIGGPLVLIPLLFGGMSLGLNLKFTDAARDHDRISRVANEHRVTILADLLVSREAVVTTSWIEEMSRRWRRMSDGAASEGARGRYWMSMAMALTVWANNLSYAAIMLGGAYMVQEHLMTSGGMMAVTMLSSRCMITISSVAMLSARFKEFRRALTELNGLIPNITPQMTTPRPSDPSGDMQLLGLTWKPRPDARPVLNGLDARVKRGDVIGIAGLPGAGKTTLLRLISGAETPSEGQVLLDLLPVGLWDRRQRARSIGYKPQDAQLFEGTLEANIRAGNERATGEQLLEALHHSGLRGAIERGELSLASEVGPRGANLSGGQRQMVSVARALLGNPSILLLDEPTTGFDAQLEQAFAQYIGSLVGKRTVLVSTHSAAILNLCSRIWVVQGGKLAADGPRERVLLG